MEFGQLIKDNVRMYNLKNHAKNETGKPAPGSTLFFKKALHEIKASDQHLTLDIFS